MKMTSQGYGTNKYFTESTYGNLIHRRSIKVIYHVRCCQDWVLCILKNANRNTAALKFEILHMLQN
jgi:hypothetical protein